MPTGKNNQSSLFYYNAYVMMLKWLFDRTVSLIGLLFLWPVLAVVAILIKMKMPGGPAFFTQKRVGRNGRLFTMHKFRSMTVSHSGSSVSVAGEARITPLGATLRKYKLDELPELWDVLIGNMSFVGPRPFIPGESEKFEGMIDKKRYMMRPGVTGLAQINGGRSISTARKLEYDVEYYDNMSFWLDLKIIITTIGQILTLDVDKANKKIADEINERNGIPIDDEEEEK